MIDAAKLIASFVEWSGICTEGWTYQATNLTLMVGRIPSSTEAQQLLQFLADQKQLIARMVPPLIEPGLWGVVATKP